MRRFFSRTVPPLILAGLGVVLGACGVPEEEPPAAVEDSRILLEEDPDAVEGVALDDEGNIIAGDLDISSEDGSVAGSGCRGHRPGHDHLLRLRQHYGEAKVRGDHPACDGAFAEQPCGPPAPGRAYG